jgi:DNA-binding response OmpR family regulator
VTEGATPSGSETILLVEDEPMILEMVTAMLQRQGYQVLIAATPGEALRLDAEVQFIQKPFSMKALSGKVREVLDGD